MLLHLDQGKLTNYHNKQHDMFLNPCQNLVWAPLEENPPIIPSLLGSFSTEVFESQPEARSKELVSSALFYFNVLFSATVSVWMSVGAIFNQVSEKYWFCLIPLCDWPSLSTNPIQTSKQR